MKRCQSCCNCQLQLVHPANDVMSHTVIMSYIIVKLTFNSVSADVDPLDFTGNKGKY